MVAFTLRERGLRLRYQICTIPYNDQALGWPKEAIVIFLLI